LPTHVTLAFWPVILSLERDKESKKEKAKGKKHNVALAEVE
jgi:hypothetical protein